jgi:hypothetical protein
MTGPVPAIPDARMRRPATQPVLPLSAGSGRAAFLPDPDDVALIAAVLARHPWWSVFWDKKYGVWRAAEDDPGSGFYAESSQVTDVIGYIQAHAGPGRSPAGRAAAAPRARP